VAPGQALELPDLVLQLGGMVQGVVVGPDGRGVSGVQISVKEEDKTSPDVTLSQSTDAQGRSPPGAAVGHDRSGGQAQHYLEETVTGVKVAEGLITKDVRIALKQGGHVKGTVVDSDGSGARGHDRGHDVSTSGMKEVRTETEQDGTFNLENLLAATRSSSRWSTPTTARGPERSRSHRGRGGEAAQAGRDPGGRGRSRGEPGRVVQRAAEPQGRGGGRGRDPEAPRPQDLLPDRRRSFEYTGIPPGTYDINVRSPSYAAFTFTDVTVTSGVKDLGKAVSRRGG